MAKVDVNISVADKDQAQFQQKVELLRAAGLEDAQPFDSIGTVSGKVDSAKLPDLRQVEGVIVEEGEEVSALNQN